MTELLYPGADRGAAVAVDGSRDTPTLQTILLMPTTWFA